MFKTDLVISKVRGHSDKYRLAVDLVWYSEIHGLIIIPNGFTTDLTTYWVEGKHTPASVLHDYVLVIGYSWPESTKIMNRALVDLRVVWWHRKLIITGLRIKGLYKKIF